MSRRHYRCRNRYRQLQVHQLMATGLEIITDALVAVGFIGQNQTLTGPESAKALRVSNDFIASMNRERLMIFRVARETASWASGNQSRTIGATGNFSLLTRPDRIPGAGRIDGNSPPGEYPLVVLDTIGQYQSIVQKTLDSTLAQYLYYDPTMPNGTIYLWPVPSVTFTIALYLWGRLTAITLAGDISLPDGYNRFLRSNLAVELGPYFNIQPSQELRLAAMDSMANIKSLNITPRPITVDPLSLSCNQQLYGYNILSDTYGGRPASI